MQGASAGARLAGPPLAVTTTAPAAGETEAVGRRSDTSGDTSRTVREAEPSARETREAASCTATNKSNLSESAVPMNVRALTSAHALAVCTRCLALFAGLVLL
jgi:hypothetical protein